MSLDRFSNPKYIDWLKEKICLQYAKEGLEPITERQVLTFHTSLSSRLQAPSSSSASAVATLCHTCLKTDLKRQWSRKIFSCLGGICDSWLDLLQKNHVHPTSTVEWDNFDVSQLPVSAWECAKVYLPYGSGKVQRAKDADLAAILTLYLNCRHFASRLQDVTLCEKVKEIRNKLLHSGTMKLENAQMLSDIGVIKQLLSDPAFAAETSCQEAITKIDQLVTGKLEMSQNKELELVVLNSDIKSVADKTDQLRQDMDNITVQVQKQYSQLKTEVGGVTTEVSSLKDQLKTHASDVDNETTSLKDKLKVTTDNIAELQKVSDLLCHFIQGCQIDKVDMEELAVSISTLSTLRVETSRQVEVIAALQETIGRHEVTLERHGRTLEEYGETFEEHKKNLTTIESDLKAKKDRSDRQNSGTGDLAALQQYLIDLYKDDCVWNNPVPVPVEPATISHMHVKPIMKVVRQKGQKVDLDKEQQMQVEPKPMPLSYRHIFYTGTEQCKNIYVTGNAGMGKTTFCKQLVYTWCKAVLNLLEDGCSAEDLNLLKEFKLLFYVNLREVESQYHIEDMIRENVLQNAPTEYNVPDILKKEKCLVVLDGLDEWSRPQGAKICRGLNNKLPGRNTLNKMCTYLTTSRNWKFCVVDLEWSKDYDKQVELCGIDEKTSWKFAEKIVDHFNSNATSVIHRSIDYFYEEVQKKKLTSLTKVPILLIHLVTLWYFCKDLGKSQVQLYCKMLNLLFDLAKKHLPEDPNTENKPVQTDTTLPDCFSRENNCQTYAQLLLCLSKLAFMSLLTKDREDSLVFNVSRLREYKIGSSDKILCLKCGIFTQDRGVGYPVQKLEKYSFLHKQLQEFLAAVYLVTSNDVDDNIRKVREYCDMLDTTLEMGQMFMFVCGMKFEVGNQLLEHLTFVASEDTNVQNSRQSLDGKDLIHLTFVASEDTNVQNSRQSLDGKDLIYDIQTCVMACVAEGASMGLTYKVQLQDFIINYDTISDYITHFVEKKNASIKSVYIYPLYSKDHVTVVMKHLQKATLAKLWLRDFLNVMSDISILAPVLTSNVSTLKSLCLMTNVVHHKSLFTAILGCIPSLRALQLGDGMFGRLHVNHGQIDLLLDVTSHLTHLCLYLYCNNHWSKCRPVLDLSHHTQIQTLTLSNMCVTNLHAVAHSVEKVELKYVTFALSTLRQFIEALAQTPNKVNVELLNVTVTEDSEDTAGLLAYLRDSDKFTLEKCDTRSDHIPVLKWYHILKWLKFHKK